MNLDIEVRDWFLAPAISVVLLKITNYTTTICEEKKVQWQTDE